MARRGGYRRREPRPLQQKRRGKKRRKLVRHTLSRVSTPLHTLRALEKKETLILRGGIAASPSGPLAPPTLVSSERRHSNLSTLLYTVSSSAQHFPPVAPAPLGRPRPPGADQIRSQFIQGQRAPVVLLSRPSTRPERGNYDPP